MATDAAYLEYTEYDMMAHAIMDGRRIASVTYQAMAECKLPGDTPEMAFARALAVRRVGVKSLVEAQRMLAGG